MNTFSITMFLRRNAKNKTIAHLYLRITVNGESTEMAVQADVNPILWSKTERRFTGRTEDIKSLNQHIESVCFRIKKCYREFDDKEQPFNVHDVRALFEGKQKPKKDPGHSGHTLLELIDYHNNQNPDLIKPGTMKNYKTTREYVARFIRFKFGREDCYLSELDFPTIIELRNYIKEKPFFVLDPCTANGLAKHMERVKKMTNLAKDKLKWIKDDPFNGFQNKREAPKIIPLSLKEFKAIENLELTNSTEILVRDLFVFAGYTGMAFCDVDALESHNLSFGTKNRIWILSYRQKSEEFFPVPMLTRAVNILTKYLPFWGKGKVFPIVTNKSANEVLKILAEKAGVFKDVHFHLARHLFGREITVKQGVPLVATAKMMGIKKLSTLQKYTDADEEMIQQSIENLDKKFA